ncbi:hypothetical protein BLNAU_10990 [Blattamonas nauphoetae]|uniref:Uncharacterized protein n=1 Tax=Blattamonas nauphoetae TaxID=2049346 RepID=A0ABQ9XSI0_9EUKA|nr:hypothetical protein BLNAU_10990 [Blattamonas nauphoetae]
MIDCSFSLHIQSTSDDPHRLLHPPSTFASDIPLLASYFGDFLESLQSCDRLLPPPEIDGDNVMTIITLTCVRHLAQRGLLNSEELSQQDLQKDIHHQIITHLQDLTTSHSSSTTRSNIDVNRFRHYLLTYTLPDFYQIWIIPVIEEHHLTILSDSSAKEALTLVFPRLMEIGTVLHADQGSLMWREFLFLIEELAGRRSSLTSRSSQTLAPTPLR